MNAARSESELPYIERTKAESDQPIVEAASAVAAKRGVSQAQIAFAWLRRNPVVAAPITGARKTKHIDDAVASLAIALTDNEAASLEAPYTPVATIKGSPTRPCWPARRRPPARSVREALGIVTVSDRHLVTPSTPLSRVGRPPLDAASSRPASNTSARQWNQR